MPISGGRYNLPTNAFAQPISGAVVPAADAAATLNDLAAALDTLAINVRSRTLRGDANYTILSADRDVVLTAALTAPRTWTLPAASAVPAGTAISVSDEAGGISSTNTLTLQRAGSDTIDGASSWVLTSAFAGTRLVSDGSARWTVVTQADDARKVGKTGSQTMEGPLQILTLSNGRQLSVRQWLDLTSGGDGFAVVANNLYHEAISNKYLTANTHASLGYSAIRLGFGGALFAGVPGAATAGAEVTPTWRIMWDEQLFRRPDTGPWQVVSSPSDGAGVTLPAGGTWAYFLAYKTIATEGLNSTLAGVAAGGTTVGGSAGFRLWGFAWRIV